MFYVLCDFFFLSFLFFLCGSVYKGAETMGKAGFDKFLYNTFSSRTCLNSTCPFGEWYRD